MTHLVEKEILGTADDSEQNFLNSLLEKSTKRDGELLLVNILDGDGRHLL